MLHVPTDNPEAMSKAFLFLADVAHGLSFDPEAIDKERGVIVEEWRQGRGADARMQDQQFPILLKGSRYGERAADRHEGEHRDLQARGAEALLHGLVPARPDGRHRRRRLRQGGGREADQGALRRDPGAAAAQAAARLRGSRPRRDALRDRHRPGGDDDDRRRLQHAARCATRRRWAPTASSRSSGSTRAC